MKEAIRDYVDRICYGKSMEQRIEILEEVLNAYAEEMDVDKLMKRVLDISRRFNNTESKDL